MSNFLPTQQILILLYFSSQRFLVEMETFGPKKRYKIAFPPQNFNIHQNMSKFQREFN